MVPVRVTHSRAFEVPLEGTKFKARHECNASLSRVLIVFLAATVSLALRAIALAQQSTKPGQRTREAINARGEINTSE